MFFIFPLFIMRTDHEGGFILVGKGGSGKTLGEIPVVIIMVHGFAYLKGRYGKNILGGKIKFCNRTAMYYVIIGFLGQVVLQHQEVQLSVFNKGTYKITAF